jgi:hypothetical protein
MNEQDIRVLLLNATAMGISMAQVEMVLKISLLVVSIGYTLQRWWLLHKERAKERTKE